LKKLGENDMSKYRKLRRVEKLLKEAKKNFEGVFEEEFEGDVPLSHRYNHALSETCSRFGIELEEDGEAELDKVFTEWNDHVNMTADELRRWSKHPCSREASVDPEAVIKRNLRLLERDKDEWTENDVEDAKRTISFISRMKAQQPDSPRKGAHGCPSKWAISLLNWAFNPFDSVPEVSKETEKDLEPVEEVTLSTELGSSYEFEPVPDQVLYSDREDALQRARDLGLEGVHEHEFGPDNVTMYMPGSSHRDWVERVKSLPDREASELFHADQERHKESLESDEGSSVKISPVSIQQVSDDELRTAEGDVDDVLDDLWSDE